MLTRVIIVGFVSKDALRLSDRLSHHTPGSGANAGLFAGQSPSPAGSPPILTNTLSLGVGPSSTKKWNHPG